MFTTPEYLQRSTVLTPPLMLMLIPHFRTPAHGFRSDSGSCARDELTTIGRYKTPCNWNTVKTAKL